MFYNVTVSTHTLYTVLQFTASYDYPPLYTQVHKPLDVKTKFHCANEEVVLEVQLQNITPSPMFLELVSFDPAHNFQAKDLNIVTNRETRLANWTSSSGLSGGPACCVLWFD